MKRQFEPLCLYRARNKPRIVSHNLRDVLPKSLTVDYGYRCQSIRPSTATLFREVEFVPLMEALTPDARKLFDLEAGTMPLSRDQFLTWMGIAITGAISSQWVPDKFHLVFHSSGWDSRILSSAIKRLYDARGADWLGAVLFVCIANENGVFEDVMHAEGWEDWAYVTIPDVSPLVEKMTDIHDAGRWLNGVVLQPTDYNWLLIEYLQDLGLIPADDNQIQLFTGRNETLMGATMPKGNGLKDSWREAYGSTLSVSRYKVNDVVFPFCDYAAVNLGLASSYRMDWSTPEKEEICHFRRDIGITICPALEGIPRGTLVMPELPAERVAEMSVAYSLTWYGMMIWPEAREDPTGKILGYHPWWGAWTAAALCEALLAEGYELNVG